MDISLRADIAGWTGHLDQVKRHQIPFAAAMALNETAFAVRLAEVDELFKAFDGPTPFTQRAFRVQKATKTALTARVFIGREQEDYLGPYIIGGTRFLGQKKGLILPINQRVNRYGNLPTGTLKRQLAKPSVFAGTVRGVGGVWQRKKVRGKSGLKLLERFVDPKAVTQRFEFYDVGVRTAHQVFPKAFGHNLARAIASMR
jgi:hypothetical protein